MEPQEIIKKHLKDQKKKERDVKICEKCRGEMTKQGIRTSGNVNYMIWRCNKCSNEIAEFSGLEKDSLKKL